MENQVLVVVCKYERIFRAGNDQPINSFPKVDRKCDEVYPRTKKIKEVFLSVHRDHRDIMRMTFLFFLRERIKRWTVYIKLSESL